MSSFKFICFQFFFFRRMQCLRLAHKGVDTIDSIDFSRNCDQLDEEQYSAVHDSHVCIPRENGFTLEPKPKKEKSYQETKGVKQLEPVFWHLEKGGGTSVIHYLADHIHTQIHVVNEHGHFRPTDFDSNYFRIGMIREPCTYYNSLYHWGNFPWTEGHGWTARHLANRGLGERFYGGGHDPIKFHKWLEYMNGVDNGQNQNSNKCGLLSMRLWTQVLNPSAFTELNKFYAARTNTSCDSFEGKSASCPCPLGDFLAEAPKNFVDRCSADIQTFDLSIFDCWIRTDHMMDDFGECMGKYEARGGSLIKDWEPEQNPIHNSNSHPPCQDMYDQHAADLVMSIDGDLKRRFGFSGKCCEIHPGKRMPT